ncbi:ribose-5-phosphate isomerase A [Lactobacillus delbrueckii subsp. lactis]|uniref:ribose-5-phosphate isomerase A n=1 Tax=Lactobacillus delbrueckii TaxID=1584 RepID=UPI001E2CB525|nr:ribose-5-phosphate isomerase A [Lactobacillus delbrueckii]MCD5446842.1 ribose-5-phosphate isomerase A [Lactobacillus delbrueckii subsp. lactis]MCD5487447.1 ribose-5-phosphate isomerase A [Lactobacillus delbrueckii subsp. lactis]MCD5494479.1 ribose-5-phosphate isomerase A [Lactobacillus delbrueckii subsp. lactis]MCD5529715.1 ribose-5-phosphate isomerase A [Lactobacillus delbrueckii subsp. lactis]MCS8607992.1 ribose-5-phosphate isomerase A [Lactobacillus delbrueckii subsp. lactis]
MTLISDFALKKIQPGQRVSLGGGSNVADLTRAIAKADLALDLYSPAPATRQLGDSLGLAIKPAEEADQLDLAFDGADSVDFFLRALKSKGGIHLFEKIAAQEADEYILLLPEGRLREKLDPDIQLCLEVAAPAVKSLLNFAKDLALKASVREDESILGNKLVDLYAENWDKIEEVNQQLVAFNGVVASSLFAGEVTSVITVQNGQAVEIGKGENHD